nr:large proline-rich protein BAG6-like isoform X1 [Ipomoea batatas]
MNMQIPVPSLKEQIAVFTGVSIYQQQLVFRGRDLRDDKLLSDYHVEDGDTIGLIVISDPPQDGGSSSGQHQGNNCSEQETQEAVIPERSPVICALPAAHNNGASDSSTRPDLAHQHGHSNNNSQQTFDQSCGDHVPMPNSSVVAPENADPQYTIPPLEDSSAEVRVREHTEQSKPKRQKFLLTLILLVLHVAESLRLTLQHFISLRSPLWMILVVS